jgi:hypothetical protein
MRKLGAGPVGVWGRHGLHVRLGTVSELAREQAERLLAALRRVEQLYPEDQDKAARPNGGDRTADRADER